MDLQQYFPKLSETQKQQFAQLPALYTEWNEKINVISRKDIEMLPTHHILHSLAIARYVTFPKGGRVLDIGTGGGFPGIPLAIFFPETEFVLSDSIGKKIKVVQAVADAIGLKNVHAIHARSESIPGIFDYAVSRAVAPLEELWSWCRDKLKTIPDNPVPPGLICLKGGDLREEKAQLLRKFPRIRITDTSLTEWFSDPYFETKRVIHVIR
jgi:16S rRNA (guanine527-N7)-methyltransferase